MTILRDKRDVDGNGDARDWVNDGRRCNCLVISLSLLKILHTRLHNWRGVCRNHNGPQLVLRRIQAAIADEDADVLQSSAAPVILPLKIDMVVTKPAAVTDRMRLGAG